MRYIMFHCLLEQRAIDASNKVAIRYYNDSLTFKELNEKANQFAYYLAQLNIKKGDRIGVYMNRCIELPIILFAIIKCGATCVPLDILAPEERIRHVLSQADLTHVIKNKMFPPKLANETGIPLLDYDEKLALTFPKTNLNLSIDENEIAYILFTSGSTGLPKGVMLEHKGLSNLAHEKVKIFNKNNVSNILQLSSIAFDAVFSEIGIHLVLGATLVITNYEDILPGNPLIDTINKFKINLIILAPSILKALLHAKMPSLKVIMSAGESCPTNYANELKNKVEFINAYGPTEASVCTTMYHIKNNITYTENIPIGKPIGRVFLKVLDEELNEVQSGQDGELFVGGVGVARGYINDPELTNNSFVCLGNKKYYKTGDIVKYLPSGDLEFVGRKDRQIKFRGIRMNLNTIENILREHPDIHEAAAVFNKDDIHIYLQSRINKKLNRIQVRKYLRNYLPDRMIPSQIIFIANMPLTLSNKVDYCSLLKQPAEKNIKSISYNPKLSDTENKLSQLIKQLVDFDVIRKKTDIFELGIDSFSVVSLVDNINTTFEIELPIRKIYELATILKISQHVDRLKNNKIEKTIDFNKEIKLNHILSRKKYDYIPVQKDNPNLFITGSTGFVGIFLLEEVLKKTTSQIYCLIRAVDNKAALRRLQITAETYKIQLDWEKHLPRLHFILGDLSKKNFMLSDAQFSTLNNNVDIIYHLASNTNFVQSYAALKKTNVFGVQEMLRFATYKKIIPIHYISTLAVFSCIHFFNDVQKIDEQSDSHLSQPYLKYDIGYVQTKWVADQMLQQAIRIGVPVSIYRPGFILCHSKTGAMATHHFWHSYIAECLKLKAYPALVNQKEEFVSVEFIVKSLLRLSKSDNSIGKIYHLCPSNSDNIDNIQCFKELQSSLNVELKELPYEVWLDLVQKDLSINSKKNELYPFLSLLRDKVYKNLSVLELYQNTPDCISVTATPLLNADNISPISMKKLLKKYAQSIGKY